jgi:glycosyltransferase involved in cell wall biosynthesis
VGSIKVKYYGFLKDEIKIRLLYSASDVFVFPSLQESFGLVAAEANACGIPVVAFNNAGLKDIIEHKRTGYLAIPFEIDDFAKGIIWSLNNNSLSQNCIENIRSKFSNEIIIEKYINCYKKVIDGVED